MEGEGAHGERSLSAPVAAAEAEGRNVPVPGEKLPAPVTEPPPPPPPPGPQAPVITANSQTSSHTGSSTNTTLQAFYTLLQHILLSHSSLSISSIGWWDFHL